MCDLGFRCRHGSCELGSNPLVGCEPGCFACAVGLMAGGEMTGTTEKPVAPPEAIHGYIVAGLGWVIDEPGKSPLQAGDIVREIAEDGGRPLPANEAWFAHHWLDLQSKRPCASYCLTYFRPGEKQMQTATLTRA